MEMDVLKQRLLDDIAGINDPVLLKKLMDIIASYTTFPTADSKKLKRYRAGKLTEEQIQLLLERIDRVQEEAAIYL